jgi:hypothetical protein
MINLDMRERIARELLHLEPDSFMVDFICLMLKLID